nr:MAG TPA: hypothetical protein [Caudoviricetes sp.]
MFGFLGFALCEFKYQTSNLYEPCFQNLCYTHGIKHTSKLYAFIISLYF